MLEDPTLRKMKVLLTSSSRLPPWSTIVSQHSQEQVKQLKSSLFKSQNCPLDNVQVAELRALTVTFLNFISGGEPARLLEARAFNRAGIT